MFKPQHCWNRTLLLYKFLKSAGYNVTIYTGIRKDAIDKTSITGHSWVTIDGEVFDDKKDVAHEHFITFHYP
ncbi:MAG: lasso peptide biosynthesis B2 protein [Deltaproteobacteria bacterium]|nr:lasso peptide biosynthesis B2 protein [Deltaproteobacteria bacterium]